MLRIALLFVSALAILTTAFMLVAYWLSDPYLSRAHSLLFFTLIFAVGLTYFGFGLHFHRYAMWFALGALLFFALGAGLFIIKPYRVLVGTEWLLAPMSKPFNEQALRTSLVEKLELSIVDMRASTKLPQRIGDFAHLRLPKDARVELKISMHGNPDAVWLGHGLKEHPMQEIDGHFYFSGDLEMPGRILIRARKGDIYRADSGVRYIDLHRDRAPEVHVLRPEDSRVAFGLEQALSLEIEAEDDFSLANIYADAFCTGQQKFTKQLFALAPNTRVAKKRLSFSWLPESLDLLPNDVCTISIVAVDKGLASKPPRKGEATIEAIVASSATRRAERLRELYEVERFLLGALADGLEQCVNPSRSGTAALPDETVRRALRWIGARSSTRPDAVISDRVRRSLIAWASAGDPESCADNIVSDLERILASVHKEADRLRLEDISEALRELESFRRKLHQRLARLIAKRSSGNTQLLLKNVERAQLRYQRLKRMKEGLTQGTRREFAVRRNVQPSTLDQVSQAIEADKYARAQFKLGVLQHDIDAFARAFGSLLGVRPEAQARPLDPASQTTLRRLRDAEVAQEQILALTKALSRDVARRLATEMSETERQALRALAPVFDVWFEESAPVEVLSPNDRKRFLILNQRVSDLQEALALGAIADVLFLFDDIETDCEELQRDLEVSALIRPQLQEVLKFSLERVRKLSELVRMTDKKMRALLPPYSERLSVTEQRASKRQAAAIRQAARTIGIVARRLGTGRGGRAISQPASARLNQTRRLLEKTATHLDAGTLALALELEALALKTSAQVRRELEGLFQE